MFVANGIDDAARLANRRGGHRVQRSLQRNPDPEEVESPLVETGVPVRRFLVAPVVDRAITPWTARRGERPIPRRSRRRAGAPRARPVAPRGAVEVAPLVIAMPRTTGTTGTGGPTRASGTTGMIGTARTARTARTTGPARTTWAAGTTRAAGIIRPGGSVKAPGLRCAMTTGARWRPARCGVGKPGAHSQGRSTERSGDGHPSDKLLQLHDASPIH